MKTSLSIQYAQMQLGIVSLRKHQIKPIQSILDHRDTLVIAPTSSGKSAIYQIAALTMAEEKGQWTLVVEPTLSLISDQVQKPRYRNHCAVDRHHFRRHRGGQICIFHNRKIGHGTFLLPLD